MRSLAYEVSLPGTSPRSSKIVVVRSLKREYTGETALRLTYENSNFAKVVWLTWANTNGCTNSEVVTRLTPF